jgi:hypothetical protein
MRAARCGGKKESSLIAIAVPGYNNRPPREGRPLNEGMIKGDWQTWEAKL